VVGSRIFLLQLSRTTTCLSAAPISHPARQNSISAVFKSAAINMLAELGAASRRAFAAVNSLKPNIEYSFATVARS
jgi:hypothetical protein